MRTNRLLVSAALLALAPAARAQAPGLPQQIADVMVQLNGGIHPGFRFTHAKGLVVTGRFTPAPSARSISRAAHLRGGPVPVTVRFSDGTGLPQVSDANTASSPRGMAIRFTLPGGTRFRSSGQTIEPSLVWSPGLASCT